MLSYQMLCPSSWAWCMRVRTGGHRSISPLASSVVAGRRRGPRSVSIAADLVYPARVTLAAVERRRQPGVGDRERVVLAQRSRAQAEHVGVVVGARDPGHLDVPGVDRAHAVDLVGGDADAHARAADQQPDGARLAPVAGVAHDGAPDRGGVVGVVAGGLRRRSEILDGVAGGAQVLDEPVAQGEPRVIAAGVDLARGWCHDRSLILQSGAAVEPRTPSPPRTSPSRRAPPVPARNRPSPT